MKHTRNLYFLAAIVLFVAPALLAGTLNFGTIGMAFLAGGLMLRQG